MNAPLPTREPRRTVHDYTPDYTADNVPQPPADIADIPPIGDPMPQARPDAAVGQAKAGVLGGGTTFPTHRPPQRPSRWSTGRMTCSGGFR